MRTRRPTSSRSAQILDAERLEVRRNSEWLACDGHRGRAAPQRRARPSRGCSSATTSRSATRAATPISVMEFLYPLLQGWDSVMVRGRRRARRHRPALQHPHRAASSRSRRGRSRRSCSRCRCSSGSTATQKMSKSLGNYIGIAEPPAEQFGKLMSLPDELMPEYFALTTGWHPDRSTTSVTCSGLRRRSRRSALLARSGRRPVPRRRCGGGRRSRVRPRLQGARRAVRHPRARPRRVARRVDGRIRLANVLRQAGLGVVEQGGAAPHRPGRRAARRRRWSTTPTPPSPAELDGSTCRRTRCRSGPAADGCASAAQER